MQHIMLKIRVRAWLESWMASWPAWRLEPFLFRVLERRAKTLPPADGIRLLLQVDAALYGLEGRTAVAYGQGLHPKHRLTRYHDFFVSRIHPGDRVLDVGCGNGALAQDIAERTGASVVGIDIEPGNIDEAQKRHAHPRVTYVVGDALKDLTVEGGMLTVGKRAPDLGSFGGPTPDYPSPTSNANPFTVVVLSNVLEHIRDRVGFLKQIQGGVQIADDGLSTVDGKQQQENNGHDAASQEDGKAKSGRSSEHTRARHALPITGHPVLRFLIRVPFLERDWRVPVKQELGVEWRLDSTHETEYTQECFLAEMTHAGLMITHQETRWGEIWAELEPISFTRRSATPSVSYFHPLFPAPLPAMTEKTSGGGVKYQWLARAMPDRGYAARVLYAVSSSHRHDLELVRRAKQAGLKIVWNQNGVFVPWTYSPDVMKTGNEDLAAMFAQADHVLYQSEYCRQSADRFVGVCKAPCEVLPNAVDTNCFVPAANYRRLPLTLLISGSHESPYRLLIALQALAAIRKTVADARLLIAGRVVFANETEREMETLGLSDCVEVRGAYGQNEAPAIYQRTDMLLHTKYADPCPTVVLEAMACGLPIVYSASGGVPELVGPDAGIGVPARLDWQNAYPPDPQELAEAVLKVADALPRYREAARQRAVDRFDLKPWIRRHREIFEMLSSG